MARRNLFIGMSDSELVFHYEYYDRMLSIGQKEDNPFYDYVCSYIDMMENESETFQYLADNKKYHAAFTCAERDLLNVIARRFIELRGLIGKIQERCFKE